MTPTKVAFYLRVSTTGQTVDNQRLALDAVAAASAGRWSAPMPTRAFPAPRGGTSGRNSTGYEGLLPSAASILWPRGASTGSGATYRIWQPSSASCIPPASGSTCTSKGSNTTTPSGKAPCSRCVGCSRNSSAPSSSSASRLALPGLGPLASKLGRPKVAPAIEEKVRELRSAGRGISGHRAPACASGQGPCNASSARSGLEPAGSRPTPGGRPARKADATS